MCLSSPQRAQPIAYRTKYRKGITVWISSGSIPWEPSFLVLFTGAVAKCQKLSGSLHYIRQAECTDLLSQPTGKNNRREIAGEDRTT